MYVIIMLIGSVCLIETCFSSSTRWCWSRSCRLKP